MIDIQMDLVRAHMATRMEEAAEHRRANAARPRERRRRLPTIPLLVRRTRPTTEAATC